MDQFGEGFQVETLDVLVAQPEGPVQLNLTPQESFLN